MFEGKSKILSIVLLTVFVVSILLVVPSCQKKGEDVIKIGAILPLTGNLSWFGEHAKNSLMLLEEALNSQNKQVKIHVYDSKSNPKDGLSAYRKMLIDNIKYCYVGLDPVSKAILPNIEKDSVMMFVGSVDNDITEESKNMFRCYYGFRDQTMAQFEFLKSKDLRSVSMLLRDVSAIKKYSEELLGEKLNGININVKNVEYFEPTKKDFRTLLTKIIANSPDAIVMSEYGALYPVIFGDLRTITSSPPLILCGFVMLNVKTENYNLYEDVVFVGPAYLGTTSSDFRSKYKQRFGVFPTYEAYYSYDSGKILFLALKSTDGSIEKVRDYILKNKFLGVSQAELRFDKNGDLKVATVLKTFKNGKIIDYKHK